MKSFGARIVSFEEFDTQYRASAGRIVAVSGGFDPIHPGHISNIQEGKKLGDTLVAIVNGDAFLTSKKGKPFQDLQTRSSIISSVQGVDFVIPFEIDNDMTVCKALEWLRPHIFAKGGDRVDERTIPEWKVCEAHDIKVVSGIGLDKEWSSSIFLKEWVEHTKKES